MTPEKTTTETTEETTKLVSKRPLYPSAYDDLGEYGILDKERPKEVRRFEVVQTEERPPVSTRKKHELRIEEKPQETWENEHGDTLEIYEDYVRQNGRKHYDRDPEELRELAKDRGSFKLVEGAV